MTPTAHTLLIEPFDIRLYGADDGHPLLHARFATWLRTLSGEARFLCWQMPATLDDRIADVSAVAEQVTDPQRRALLVEYRREYERMNQSARYQRSLCGMGLWNDDSSRSVAGGLAAAFDTPVWHDPVPPR